MTKIPLPSVGMIVDGTSVRLSYSFKAEEGLEQVDLATIAKMALTKASRNKPDNMPLEALGHIWLHTIRQYLRGYLYDCNSDFSGPYRLILEMGNGHTWEVRVEAP